MPFLATLMAKFLFTTFNFKLLRPTQKLEPVLTCLRCHSTDPLEFANVASNVNRKSYKERPPWNDQDTDKLLKLVEEHGPKWKPFKSYFPERTAHDIRVRFLTIQDYFRWTQEEKNNMHELLLF